MTVWVFPKWTLKAINPTRSRAILRSFRTVLLLKIIIKMSAHPPIRPPNWIFTGFLGFNWSEFKVLQEFPRFRKQILDFAYICLEILELNIIYCPTSPSFYARGRLSMELKGSLIPKRNPKCWKGIPNASLRDHTQRMHGWENLKQPYFSWFSDLAVVTTTPK